MIRKHEHFYCAKLAKENGFMMSKYGKVSDAGLTQALNAITYGDCVSQVRAAIILKNTPDANFTKEIKKFIKLSGNLNPFVLRILKQAKVRTLPNPKIIHHTKRA